MGKVNITISTDSAAFSNNPAYELSRILRQLADKIENHGAKNNHPLTDINGNSIGEYIYIPDIDVKKGQQVFFKPEFSDSMDNETVYIALDNMEKGRVTVAAINTGLFVNPTETVADYMIEKAVTVTKEG